MRRALVLALVLVSLVGVAGARAPSSGVVGQAFAGPTCPVERVPPEPGCSPRPLAVVLRIHRLDRRAADRVLRSGPDGRFRVLLAPGRYRLAATSRSGGVYPRPPAPQTLAVHRGRFTRVVLEFDTGIR